MTDYRWKNTLDERENLFCVCGHKQYNHEINRFGGYCISIIDVDEEGFNIYCRCEAYKRDNLKYMEQVYEQGLTSSLEPVTLEDKNVY